MSGSGRSEATEQVILGLAQEVFTAIRKKDASSLERILADDFIHRSADGSESVKEEFLQGISAMPMEITSVRGEQQKVSVYGEVEVMTGIQHADWRQGDEAAGVSSVAFVDVFVLRDGRWLMVLAYGVELPG